jgi:hypothetical protein
MTMNSWIVMTSKACMPASVRSPYRNVAIVKLTPEYAAADKRPAMISTRARGVAVLKHRGHHFVGRTDRCAYRIALAEAEAEVAILNLAEAGRREHARRAMHYLATGSVLP